MSVLTYNVHGLPWPLATGRPAAFARMETRLRAMRHEGVQPHIVVLQEAFTADAKQIGRQSGYRYIVDGPGRALRTPAPEIPADAAFAAHASFWRGESGAKLVDSGLQILSDYPILSVRRAAFPAFACAGFDCLANKGILLATIAVPSEPRPITIVTAHLNSRGASGASHERSFQAYRRQLDIMDDFLRTNSDPRLPMIVAGDFNTSGAIRRAYLTGHVAASWAFAPERPVHDALVQCFARATSCNHSLSRADVRLLTRAKDRQFFLGSSSAHLLAAGLFVPFQREADGTMLSDHIGYGVLYGLGGANPPGRASTRQKRV